MAEMPILSRFCEKRFQADVKTDGSILIAARWKHPNGSLIGTRTRSKLGRSRRGSSSLIERTDSLYNGRGMGDPLNQALLLLGGR
jgi:hypothetical protein